MSVKSAWALPVVAPLALALWFVTGVMPESKEKATGSGVHSTPEPNFAATCFCKISKDNLTNVASATGVLLDLTSGSGGVNKQYTGINAQGQANQTDCNTRCTNASAPHVGSQAIATAACAMGAPNGTLVRSWSAVGDNNFGGGQQGRYRSAAPIGTLKNIPAVTQATCPPGSISNTSNQPGVTADGRCKKMVCGNNTGTPLPPNGTAIGTWGFTWGNQFWQWITPNISIITPAQCSF